MMQVPLLGMNLTQAPESNFKFIIKKDAACLDIPTFMDPQLTLLTFNSNAKPQKKNHKSEHSYDRNGDAAFSILKTQAAYKSLCIIITPK